jgi:plasmid stabilization system protein ParE
MRAILAPSALKDIKEILLWSEEKFGKDAALHYEALLVQAVRDIEANPARPGVSHRETSRRTFLSIILLSAVAGWRVRQ